jgi:23S rRNA A2030 N6-methylase RlmJ
MIVVNPPFALERQLTVILPELAARLGGESGFAKVTRLP